MIVKLSFVFYFLFKVIGASDVDESTSDAIIHENMKSLGDAIDVFQEGDMLIPSDAPLDVTRRRYWPNGEVAYRMTSDYSAAEKQIIRNALALITQAAPCIKFREYTTNPPRAHVEVFKGSGCFSSVGRTGFKQQLSLARGCLRSGTVIHEFCHSLGFYHEQSRPDRDEYININYQNIQAGREHNFRKATSVDSLGIEYDRESIMHYSGNAFSNGKGRTITWKANQRLRLGGSVLSTKDKQQLNLLYCKSPIVTVTQRPVTTRIPITRRPTTTRRPITRRPTTTRRPITQRPTTTRRPITRRPTTTRRPITRRPTTTRRPITRRPTTTRRPITRRPTSTRRPITRRPTTTRRPITRQPVRVTRTTKKTFPRIIIINPRTIKACGDTSGNCINIQFLKRPCNSGERTRCPYSCNVCRKSKAQKCLNLRNVYRNCNQFAAFGYCNARNSKTRYQMKANCARSCCDRNELYKFPQNSY